MLSTNNKKQLVIILILLILFIAFEPLWRELYASFIIKNFFRYFNPSFLPEILFYLVSVLSILFLIKKLKLNYQLSINFVLVSILVGLIYLYYRFDDHFIFYNLRSIKFIYYSDVFLLASIFVIVLLPRNIFSRSQQLKSDKGFITDSPLREVGKDLYRREDYARQLALKLNETTSVEALAVGINGEWGIGKTSFFDLLKRHIDKESFIFVDFNPWGSINEENVIQNFFKTLISEVKKYSSRLSSSITDYSNSLSNVTDNNIIKSSVDILKISLNESLDQKFIEINNLLRDINKRIIIFIDDLDRLQRDEIIQVIKLIRNTANFGNTIFIVAYDRNYICRAFDELGKTNSLYYLEKIFQLEIDLPYIDSTTLRKELIKYLKANLDEKDWSEIEKLYSSNTSKAYPFLDQFLKTLRDVNRFVNLFCFQYNQIQDEVSFTDYFNITLVKMRYPELIQLLYRRQDEFLEKATKEDTNKMYLKLEEDKTLLSKYLIDKMDSLNLSEEDIKTFDNAIRSIFGQPVSAAESKDEDWTKFGLTFYAEREINSIVFPNTFYRYFSNQIFSKDISDKEWKESFRLPEEQFVNKLKGWIKRGARSEVYYRINMIKDFKTRENFEKVISALFELANFKIDSDEHPSQAWYDYGKLFYMLYRYNEIKDQFYEGNLEDYKKFLNTLFIKDKDPNYFIVGFIYTICNDLNYHRSFPISLLELMKINAHYLGKYLEAVDSLDKKAWELFYFCKYVDARPDHSVIHPIVDEAKNIMKEFFKKKGIEYFLQSVAIATYGNDRYYLSDGVWAVFGPPDGVLNFVDEFGETPMIKEFKEFYSSCKETGFQSYIKFDFKEIKIDR